MNIEKSIDIIKGKLLMIDKMLKQDQEEGHGSAYEMQTEDFEAIETLLTAYEKEKEKNKKIENKMNELVDDYENQLLEKNNYIFNLENEREALWNKLDEEFD